MTKIVLQRAKAVGQETKVQKKHILERQCNVCGEVEICKYWVWMKNNWYVCCKTCKAMEEMKYDKTK